MAMVIFRIKKLKTMGNVGGAAMHNTREMETSNAITHDPSHSAIAIVSPPAGMSVVDALKEKLEGVHVRSNAVLAVEVLISASPEYFRPDNPSAAGTWDIDKLDAWRKAQEKFIAKEFPHAVSVMLHLDEATPHYQIIDVPIDEKGKLNARGKYSGDTRNDKLKDWQTKAANAVRHLGIERGVMGSKAEHKDVKRTYGQLTAPTPELEALPEPILPSLLNRGEAGLKAFANEQRKIAQDAIKPTLDAAIIKARFYDDAVERNEQNRIEIGRAHV